MNLRWRDGRSRFRSDTIQTSEYDVAEIPSDSTARAFVEQHHYSRSYPAARFRFGLYHCGRLAGVAVFSHPCNDRVLTGIFPGSATASVELGRFVLLDEVPGNGETWFLARCFELLRRDTELVGVVSFSDPIARWTADGALLTPGHVGTIYQAFNGAYLGRGTPRSLRMLPDGRVLSARAISKIRSGEKGWRYSAAILEAIGAEPIGIDQRQAWLSSVLVRFTTIVRHPGNHKYAWALARSARRYVVARAPYPKLRDATQRPLELDLA